MQDTAAIKLNFLANLPGHRAEGQIHNSKLGQLDSDVCAAGSSFHFAHMSKLLIHCLA